MFQQRKQFFLEKKNRKTSIRFAVQVEAPPPQILPPPSNLTVSQILSIENLLATRATWQCAGDRAGDGDADGGD
jgi:hypothetical protein